MVAAIHRLLPGRPYPLGAHCDETGVNFAMFSAHASKMELCLFDAAGRQELAKLPLPECTDEIWHGYLPGGYAGQVYGRSGGEVDVTLLLVNDGSEDASFVIPSSSFAWRLLMDSADPAIAVVDIIHDRLSLQARSVVLSCCKMAAL